MRRLGFAKGYDVKREVGLMGWMILKIVRVGEWLTYEGAVVVVCYRMVRWLRRSVWVLHLKWKREGRGGSI